MGITHSTVATGTDAGNGDIHKAEWNAGHVVTGLGGGALVLLEQHAASSSATLDFASFISSDYDEYVFEFVGIIPASNNVSFQMRMSTGGTYDTGNNYAYGMLYSGIGDTPTQSSGSGVSAIDLAHNVSTTANYSVNGSVRLFSPAAAAYKFIEGKTQAMAGGSMYQWGNSGVYLSTTAVDAVRFLFSSGNIASGTIRVYGVAKATIAPTGGGLTLLEQHTASSSAQLDFTGFISSTYDEYLFEFVNVLPATNDVGFRMRMGTGGGPTFDTGNNYGWDCFVMRAGGSAPTGAEGGVAFIQLNFGSSGSVGVANTANWGGVTGHLRMYDPASSIYTTTIGQTRNFDSEPFRLMNFLSGSYETTTPVTAVRFYFSSGNIASGVIRVYGVGK